MTAWRVARSLETLLAQINAAYPNRSKAADGSIGDTAHAASVSDHNPDAAGVVRARDYTHDPAHGFDAHAMADHLVASRDPRIKYVISRGRIASSTIAPWQWRTYTGSNRHDHHAHVSVVPDARADNTRPWTITNPQEEEMTPDDIRKIAQATAAEVWATKVPRPGNEPSPAGSQLGGANINAYRALNLLKAQDEDALIEAVTAAVKAADQAETPDVNALARAIVLELGKDAS